MGKYLLFITISLPITPIVRIRLNKGRNGPLTILWQSSRFTLFLALRIGPCPEIQHNQTVFLISISFSVALHVFVYKKA